MKILYQVKNYDMGAWRDAFCTYAENQEEVKSQLSNASSRVYPLYAVLTNEDIVLKADLLSGNPFFHERFQLHCRGYLNVDTESGTGDLIPYTICDADCFIYPIIRAMEEAYGQQDFGTSGLFFSGGPISGPCNL